MKGTIALTTLSADFQERLKADDPTLAESTYTGAAYDAVIPTRAQCSISSSSSSQRPIGALLRWGKPSVRGIERGS